jgi:hypothetical protein
MRYLKYAGLLGILLFAAAGAHAQVRVGIGVGPVYVGPQPVCAYGYYPYYPYACAPNGYWGPSYFVSGVFIGAGPWYHAHWAPRYYGRPGYAYRPGYVYRGAPAHGYAGGGYRGGHAEGGFHGGAGFHGGGGRGR